MQATNGRLWSTICNGESTKLCYQAKSSLINVLIYNLGQIEIRSLTEDKLEEALDVSNERKLIFNFFKTKHLKF